MKPSRGRRLTADIGLLAARSDCCPIERGPRPHESVVCPTERVFGTVEYGVMFMKNVGQLSEEHSSPLVETRLQVGETSFEDVELTFTLVRCLLALIGHQLALVGKPFALIRGGFALISGAVPLLVGGVASG